MRLFATTATTIPHLMRGPLGQHKTAADKSRSRDFSTFIYRQTSSLLISLCPFPPDTWYCCRRKEMPEPKSTSARNGFILSKCSSGLFCNRAARAASRAALPPVGFVCSNRRSGPLRQFQTIEKEVPNPKFGSFRISALRSRKPLTSTPANPRARERSPRRQIFVTIPMARCAR